MNNNYVLSESLPPPPNLFNLQISTDKLFLKSNYSFGVNIKDIDCLGGCDTCRISIESFLVVTGFITQVKELVLSKREISNCQTISNHLSYQDIIDHQTCKK